MTNEKRLLVLAAILAIAVWLLSVLSGILMPFVAGALVAYLFDPVADRFEKWGCSRTVATTLVTAGFVLALVALIVVLVPLLQDQIAKLVDRMPQYVAALKAEVQQAVERSDSESSRQIFERVRSLASEHMGQAIGWLGDVLKQIVTGGFVLFNVLSLVVITPLVAFYLLLDWDRIVAQIDNLLPRDVAPSVRQVVSDIDRTLAGFVRGQGLVCLILGALYAVGLTVAGLDFGLVVGLIAGFISFVPFVGSTVGLVLGVGIAFFQFDSWVRIAVIAGVFLVGQFVEGNFLTPRIVGGRIGLHPVWVIFALLAGGSLFGFTGVLLAVPVAAAIGVLIRFWAARYRQSALYHGRAPTVILKSGDEGQ